MLAKAYKRPPITEAVIELRAQKPAPHSEIDKIAHKLQRRYSHSEPETGKTYTIDFIKDIATHSVEWSGIKYFSPDLTDITIVRTNGFVCSRLAPYPGWEAFVKRAKEDWDIIRPLFGPGGVARVGVRYINRIDIPNTDRAQIALCDYLNIGPQTPNLDWKPTETYFIQVTRELDDGCSVTINSGTVASPLIGHLSVTLDIDVANETHVPPKDQEMWQLIDSIRKKKDKIFEACITDAARELFDR